MHESDTTSTPRPPAAGAAPRRAWLLWGLIGTVLVSVTGLYLTQSLGRRPPEALQGTPVDPQFELPAMTLIEASGEPLALAALRGRVWIADFIFTSCAGPCPLMTQKMRQLQSDLADIDDLRLVSISVDPARDTPAVLRDYARRVGAQPGRWLFLTGEMEQIYDLAIGGFKITVEEARASAQIIHDTRFILVDADGRVRGYFDSDDPADLEALRDRARELAGQPGPRGQRMDLQHLPALNAGLNTLATLLLVCGWRFIRRRQIAAHRNCMVAAFVVSTLFLISYLVYHFKVQATTPFSGPAALRPAYLALLASHVILAMAVPPLAGVTLLLGLRDQRVRHRRIARVTLPIWLYVSVTGVLIYLTLYHVFPAAAPR